MALPRSLQPSASPVEAVCPLCQNRRHIRQSDGHWARCRCLVEVLRHSYISPLLHDGETSLPDDILALPPIPLTDSVHMGDLHRFRRMAWRSLVEYEPQGLYYDVISANRLNDVDFGREKNLSAGYVSLSELAEPHLLIVLIFADVGATSWTLVSFANMLRERQIKGHPTWVFSELRLAKMHDLFERAGDRITTAIRPMFASTNVTNW